MTAPTAPDIVEASVTAGLARREVNARLRAAFPEITGPELFWAWDVAEKRLARVGVWLKATVAYWGAA